jgi:hypothetical protein
MRIPAINGRIWKVIGASFLGVAILLAVLFATPLLGSSESDGNVGGYRGYGECFYCTQTQGDWGSECSGGNVGCLRDSNWDTVIGGSLVVGGTYTITFTSSSAVETYVPAAGTAASLAGNHVDPSSTESGILGGQVTALKLNVLFSDAGIGMICPDCILRDLEIAYGPFAGWTVGDFLALAEDVLGGNLANLPPGTTISDVNEAASLINQNFLDCTENNGFLLIP